MSFGPVGNLDVLHVRLALEAAEGTPSLNGHRPWRLVCTPSSIEVHSEVDIDLTAVDRSARAVLVECGAVLLNLRLAIRSAGVVPDVRLLPDPHRPDLLASVGCLVIDGPMAVGDRRLVEAIHHHYAHPDHFSDTPVPAAVLGEMRAAARAENAWLSEITDENRSAVEDLRIAADRASGTEPLLVCIGSFTDRPVDHLIAGQAMQRVLLTAMAAAVAASFVPEPVVVDTARLALRRVLGGGLWPQAVLRLGYSEPGSTDADRLRAHLSTSAPDVELPVLT